jgi:hypothetical protein
MPKRRKPREHLTVPDWAEQHELWRKFTAEAQRQIIWAARNGEDWEPALSAWNDLSKRQQDELGLALQLEGRWAAVHGLLKDFTGEEQRRLLRGALIDERTKPAHLVWSSLGPKDRAIIAKAMDHFLNYQLPDWHLTEKERRIWAEAVSRAKAMETEKLLEDHVSLFETLKAATA